MQNVKLQKIARKLKVEIQGDENTLISNVTHDSRQAGAGSLFVAVKGLTVDGHRFIPDVMRRGAIGVISESEMPVNFRGVWLKVENSRRALAQAAAVIYQNPSHDLDLVGITGTNGKTTTTYLMFALAEANKIESAMLTTVEYRIRDKSEPAVRTTPEASDTNKFLRRAVDENCRMAVMETSSQALDLHRCDNLRFKAAVFTNLTRDHLDYHLTMENYFAAKKRLFDGSLGEKPIASIINIDDEWGIRLADELKSQNQKVVTFAQNNLADLTAKNIEVSLLKGTSFLLKTQTNELQINSPLIGKPHVYNMLAAVSVALELGYDLDLIVDGLKTCIGAPGRFERVPHEGDFAVVVDYAHSDDALLNTLKTARELTEGKIITVFGCGGDRDKTKRVPMGLVAGKLSDLVIITSDNPRTEDPLKIISQIENGLKKTTCSYLAISDRREAIYQAIKAANPNDVVLIAGKGHETYQMIGSDKFHFDDREIAIEALNRIND
ncbi:MAG: UDP-N-acetylmuramoyl-L-alanyl-D-glutamate--2,6-diaminopimelate ligase [Pyrinomonadaceae bacterium]